MPFDTYSSSLICTLTEHSGDEATWCRHTAPNLNPSTDALIFQQIEVDEYMDGITGKPVVRLYGVTEQGNSVLCHVQNFLPYFYTPAPRDFNETHIEAFTNHLDVC
jgi:DNA polymerase delta subunit 1